LVTVGIYKISEMKEHLHNIYSEHMHFFLLIIYLFVPPVANAQFRALNCQTLVDGQSYLRADTSVDCNSHEYAGFVVHDGLMIAAFQCLPLLYIILLCRVRDKLMPNAGGNHELALEIRDHDPALQPVKVYTLIDTYIHMYYLKK
jgi:hypothetical protein